MVNGETFSMKELKSATVSDLIEHFKLSPGRVAVEINGNIIERAKYSETKLSEDDKVEIIHFVGGG